MKTVFIFLLVFFLPLGAFSSTISLQELLDAQNKTKISPVKVDGLPIDVHHEANYLWYANATKICSFLGFLRLVDYKTTAVEYSAGDAAYVIHAKFLKKLTFEKAKSGNVFTEVTCVK